VIELRPGDPPAQTLALAAGLALAEAVDVAAPAQALMLKWPNDLMLLGKKLGGILLERSGERVAACRSVSAGAVARFTPNPAATLGGAVSPQAFAPLLAASFARLLGLWRISEPRLLAHAWLARAHPIGTRLKVHASEGELVSGRFDGVEPDGALRLLLPDGSVEIVRAGDVEL
jgi:BirA family transcriptional regulator, biotin operon repressor / biotin---[acetyl-CoA-carboxylase] ligase